MFKKALVGLSVALVAMLAAGCSDVRFVDQIVIDNPTAFTANVDVTGRSRDGWVGLATVQGGEEAEVEQVVDHGTTWIFRFAYSGYEEELTVTRSELARADWHVEVPDSFADSLRERGIVPPP